MARTLNPDEHILKRNEILDVVQHLIYTRGYEQMTIQQILSALKISKGAFYHYFDSKPALLEAVVERMINQAEEITSRIVEDPDLTAIEKFQSFYDSIASWKASQKGFVAGLIRIWFADENAIVRHKVNLHMSQRIAPLFSSIVRQGIEEGVFAIRQVDFAGDVILSIMVGMQHTIGRLMLESEYSDDPAQQCSQITATYDAHLAAMERTLGACENVLFRVQASTVQMWIDALREQV